MPIEKMIDHTLLKADATEAEVIALCMEAKEAHFASVCINPVFVKTAYRILKGTDVKVCTVIGFPLGANTTEAKAFEAKTAVEQGAMEVDMVIHIGAVKAGDLEGMKGDVSGVVKAAKGACPDCIVKVIIETALLTDAEIEEVSRALLGTGADFVKTSTGFSTGGARAEDVARMKGAVGDGMEVKASGGVRTYADAQKMMDAGATRIGTSNGLTILEESRGEKLPTAIQ